MNHIEPLNIHRIPIGDCNFAMYTKSRFAADCVPGELKRSRGTRQQPRGRAKINVDDKSKVVNITEKTFLKNQLPHREIRLSKISRNRVNAHVWGRGGNFLIKSGSP